MSAQASHTGWPGAYQPGMPIIQLIELDGEPVAVTIGADSVVISDHVAGFSLPLVKRMCLFALQIACGDRPGPYRSAEAEQWARTGRLKLCGGRSR